MKPFRLICCFFEFLWRDSSRIEGEVHRLSIKQAWDIAVVFYGNRKTR